MLTFLFCLIRGRRHDFRILAFHLPELFGSHEADRSARLLREQDPRRLLHKIMAGNAAITIGRAFPYRVGHSRIRFEHSAENLFFRRTIPLANNAPGARNVQRYSLFRRSSFDFDGDHDFSFSKKRTSASGRTHLCRQKLMSTQRARVRAKTHTTRSCDNAET